MKKIYLLVLIILVTNFCNAQNQWVVPNTYVTQQWVKLGTFAAGSYGQTIRLTAYIHQGYNASNGQDATYVITFKTSNGSSVDGNGFAGNSSYFAVGENSTIPPGSIKWVANAAGVSANSFDLYIYMPTFTEGSHYTATWDPDAIWTNVGATGQTDPGVASATVLIPPAEFDLPYGNAGVGIASPISSLTVNGGITTIAPINLNNTTPTLAIGYDNVNDVGQVFSIANTLAWKPLNLVAHSFNLLSDGTVQGLHQSSGGAVGIGTATPSAPLQVAGAAATEFVRVSSTAAGSGGDFDMYSSGTGGFNPGTVGLNTSGATPLAFNVGANEIMRLVSNGNVGIGTTTPTAKLDVRGTSFFSDGTQGLTVGAFTGGDGYGAVYSYGISPNNSNWALAAKSNETDLNAAPGGSINLAIGAVSNMTMTSSGNVGIGTTSPDEKLTVNGTIHSTEVRVTSSVPYPDYVFQPSYRLPKLNEIKTFIDKNHHLPEVPTDDEVAKNGLNVGQSEALLLKKVEELTLYLIVQQKMNASLQAQINALKKSKNVHQRTKSGNYTISTSR